MNKRSFLLTIVLLFALFYLPPGRVWAQEESGYKETFDDPTLPEWEHSREAVVANSVLKMSPGSFALRFGDWSEITLATRVKYSGEGEVVISYYVRDEGHYGLILRTGSVSLEKEADRAITPLGNAVVSGVQADVWLNIKIVVSGDQHQVYVGDELQLSAIDDTPLETGAVMLHVRGEATAEFDDLEVRGKPGAPPAGEAPPPPQGDAREPAVDDQLPVAPTVGAPAQPQGKTGLVEEFFAGQAANQDLATLVINLVLAAICAYILSLVYIHWGASLSNRRKFASNFMLMTITTTFIILVVRSSVALSLGLVGALSIVRFRTAVKEAEELAYLFFSVGLGIGLGDNQRLVTLLALATGVVIIGLLKLFRRAQADVNLHLTITSHRPHKIELEAIMQALEAHTAKLKLLRFDETAETLETAFLVEFTRLSNLNNARAALKALSESVEITFLDNKGIW